MRGEAPGVGSLTALDRALSGRSYGVAREQARTILTAVEHETIDLPAPILGKNGRLDVYPDVLRLFQVRFKDGLPVLQLDRYVGYIPLNDDFAIDVRPRVPIGNLERLVRLATGFKPVILANYLRAFSYADERPPALLDVIADHLLQTFDRLWDAGLLSEYELRQRHGTSPVGRINTFASALRTMRSGQPQSVSSAFHRTRDIGPNRTIRFALERLLRQVLATPEPALHSNRRVALRRALAKLDAVLRPTARQITNEAIADYIRRLPYHHDHYADALILSQMVISEAGLSIRGKGALTVLPTVLIDMEKVFEDYMRQMLARAWATDDALDVRDGNREGDQGAKTYMFADRAPNQSNSGVTPDIVVMVNAKPDLIIDAKYKPQRGLPDRGDLNQVVTYGVRYGCSKVMLLYPNRKMDGPFFERLGSVGGINVYIARIDLDAKDIEAEERLFAEALAELMAPENPAPNQQK